jgi:hypothetical protein
MVEAKPDISGPVLPHVIASPGSQKKILSVSVSEPAERLVVLPDWATYKREAKVFSRHSGRTLAVSSCVLGTRQTNRRESFFLLCDALAQLGAAINPRGPPHK